MSFIDSLDFVGKDDRVRKFLFPKKIIGTWGNVIGAEKLLEEKPLQIGLSEQSVTNLINKDSNEKHQFFGQMKMPQFFSISGLNFTAVSVF